MITYNCVDLHSIGGLVPLLGFLKNSHANIRAKEPKLLMLPGVSALKLANGYAGLRDALASGSVDVLHPKIHSSVFSLKSFPENPATKNG
ncbi:hypothetical protein Bca52824_021468 [Brassica carinata]|uniref:Uncharacterized protein n=1 Tax=Brassica carinata TaxID=52824 RepID=A0A8X7VER5_BRACI|nr:hypothetical protein Bca52824_021468 [Brassica carinata]